MTATPDAIALPPGARLAIIAGGGVLPLELARSLAEAGRSFFVLRIAGEADQDFSAFPVRDIALEAICDLTPILRQERATHAVFAGGISRRPDIRAVKFGLALLPLAFRAARAFLRGDDAVLGTLVGFVESRGVRVLGAHHILTRLLAPEAALTERKPTAKEMASVRAGFAAAKAIGALDIGQAAVVIGERAVAVEGAEGTAAMIARVGQLKASGRIPANAGGVLVKCPKPGQEQRIDLPAIGPETVEAAIAAGLAGIAVEAGSSLILSAPQTIAAADAAGLFIVGARP